MFEWIFVGLILLLLFGPILLDYHQPVDPDAGEADGYQASGRGASLPVRRAGAADGSGAANGYSGAKPERAEWFAVPVPTRSLEERVRALERAERRRPDLASSLERAARAGAGRNPRF